MVTATILDYSHKAMYMIGAQVHALACGLSQTISGDVKSRTRCVNLITTIVCCILLLICYRQEYIIGRERESILLNKLLCKHIADNKI